MNFLVDKEGYYGEFGGAYVPEILHKCVEELQNTYLKVLQSEDFKREYDQLLRDYVGRPSPLYLAHRLSEKYGCRIYLKREDLNHTGAHKINNSIGQVLLARRMGKRRIIAETGAGQHGVATATVCALMNMECIVYMGKTDVERQRVNVEKMKMLGATVVPVTSGNMTLKDATNEAIRDWCCHPSDTYYVIGSTVGPHPYPDMVARLQSVISEEIRKQLLEHEGRECPDYLIACVGGGSNAAGTIYHYVNDPHVQIVLAEAGGKGIETGMTAATIALGKMGIIHGSRTYVIQNEDGQIEEPYSISAGLDYPGIGPMHANLAKQKRAIVLAVNDDEAIRAACRYLKDMYAVFGDWMLAIASYNCGPGNVNKAIARSGGGKTFWEIYDYLPRETRGYVPAFIGASYAYAYHKQHGIELTEPPLPLAVDTIRVTKLMHLGQVASTLDLPIEVLRQLNPQYRLDIIPATGKHYTLVLPQEYACRYIACEEEIQRKDSLYLKEYINPVNVAKKRAATSSYLTHTVKRGETLGYIARKYRVSQQTIMRDNRIRNANRLSIGQKLKIRRR